MLKRESHVKLKTTHKWVTYHNLIGTLLYLRRAKNERGIKDYNQDKKPFEIGEAENFFRRAWDTLGFKESVLALAGGNVYFQKAFFYKEFKDISNATKCFAQAIELYQEACKKQDLAEAYYNLSRIYSEELLANPRLAYTYADKAIEILIRCEEEPSEDYFSQWLQVVMRFKKESGSAGLEEWLKKIKELKFKNTFKKGGYFFKKAFKGEEVKDRSKLEQALGIFKQIEGEYLTEPNLFFRLGRCYAALKNHKEASTYFQKAVKGGYKDTGVVYLEWARSFMDQGEFERALDAFERAVEHSLGAQKERADAERNIELENYLERLLGKDVWNALNRVNCSRTIWHLKNAKREFVFRNRDSYWEDYRIVLLELILALEASFNEILQAVCKAQKLTISPIKLFIDKGQTKEIRVRKNGVIGVGEIRNFLMGNFQVFNSHSHSKLYSLVTTLPQAQKNKIFKLLDYQLDVSINIKGSQSSRKMNLSAIRNAFVHEKLDESIGKVPKTLVQDCFSLAYNLIESYYNLFRAQLP